MCFEGMEESGSVGLEEFVKREKDAFFTGIDAVCISDNYWLTTTTPALTYGLRGLMYQKVTISGPSSDLHSGVFGGTVHEPMTDLFHLFSKLVSPSGEILVPGVKDLIAPLTDEEKCAYVYLQLYPSKITPKSIDEILSTISTGCDTKSWTSRSPISRRQPDQRPSSRTTRRPSSWAGEEPLLYQYSGALRSLFV